MTSLNPLAVRMKDYEFQMRSYLPRKTWNIIRLDGKAFHTYTRNLGRPYDLKFLQDMDETMRYLCENIEGAVFGYTQSDEISIVFTDLGSEQAQLWFGGEVQKIVSVTAGMASARFNQLRPVPPLGVFDSRVFAVPSHQEVINYLRWRQADAVRNALFMAASRFYSHQELHGRSREEKISMLANVGTPWPDHFPARFTKGGQVSKVYKLAEVSYTRKDTGETLTTEAVRAFWQLQEAEDFHSGQFSPTFVNLGEEKCETS